LHSVRRHAWMRYLAALAAAAGAILLRELLDPFLGHHQFLGFLFVAIAVTAWRAGPYPAAVTSVVGYAATRFLFFEPRGSLAAPDLPDWVAFGTFGVCAGTLIGMGALMRRGERALRERQDVLIERQRVEKELEVLRERMRERLQIVTDAMEAPVTWCSRELDYTWVSRSYAEWLGVRPEAITGRPILDVVGQAAFDRLRPYFDRVLTGETVRYEEQLDFKGLGPRWVQGVYTPTRDAGGYVDGWVAVVSDVDRQKRAQESLLDADRKKNEFLAVLAHELRNPLAPIRNAVHYLKEAGPPQRDLQEAGDIIDRQINQLTRLVDDLLELSRITQGMVEVRKVRMELAPVIHMAVEASAPFIALRGHDLKVSVPSEPIWLEADPVRLGQILMNLLQNAAKYTNPGGHIWLSARREGRDVILSIRDTGIGLAEGSTSWIFEMFTRTESQIRSQGGLGIGLALVRGLVELHGGTVRARSAGLGQGSEFIVRLPAPAYRGLPLGIPGEVGVSAALASRHRILVVDDNKDTAESLRMLLALHGHVIRTAYDGIHALAEADAFRPEVVLLDIGLPRMDGYEVARAIRGRDWGGRTLLVAVTGWGLEDDRERARQAGFDHHLTKPTTWNALENVLRTAPDRLHASAAS